MNQPIKSEAGMYNYKYFEFPTGMLTLQIPASLSAEFKASIQRSLSTNPDASPMMKELGDMITNGKVLQDYWGQAGKKPPEGILNRYVQQEYQRNNQS